MRSTSLRLPRLALLCSICACGGGVGDSHGGAEGTRPDPLGAAAGTRETRSGGAGAVASGVMPVSNTTAAGSTAPALASAGAAGMPADAGIGPEDAGADTGMGTLVDAAPASRVRDPGTDGDGDFTVGPNYTTSRDLADNGAPKGRSFSFTMASTGSIFAGDDTTLLPQQQRAFVRRIDVYVPARYVDGTPAPVLVIHDGPGPLSMVRNALDNLTAEADPARKLPAFIAIAVANGGSDSKGSERGLEYDTMSDRFARFIQLEVLPAVLADPAIAQAYPGLTFTDDPEGRATLGCSSGGAAALTMGWFRPEWFRRLITYSGTFVDQQDDDAPEEADYPLGAWEYHSGMELIANSERKPLRIFMHVSDRDLQWDAPESNHHNWVIAAERTAAALASKGYHYRFISATNAGHCDSRVIQQTLAETLLWTWRGYPSD
jgi:iron(III)-enterobactin esterase